MKMSLSRAACVFLGLLGGVPLSAGILFALKYEVIGVKSRQLVLLKNPSLKNSSLNKTYRPAFLYAVASPQHIRNVRGGMRIAILYSFDCSFLPAPSFFWMAYYALTA